MTFHPKSEEHFHRLWKGTNFFIALVMAAVGVIADVALNHIFTLSVLSNFVLAGFLIVLYLVFISILFDFNVFQRVRVVEKEVMREIEKSVPVIQEVIVEKPVYRDVKSYVYVTNPRKKLDIHKYEYVGSTETGTYHKRTCRFSKLIKKKYKVANDSASYFAKKGFKQCKSCLKRAR